MVCTDRCKHAKGDICKCSCNGINHGTKIEEIDPLIEFVLTEKQAKPFREQMNRRNICGCGYIDLHKRPIYAYSHEGGWYVKEKEGTWWLWIHCPKCHYEWSLWKLGVSRFQLILEFV